MKRFAPIFVLFFLGYYSSLSQSVSIDDMTNSASDLVDILSGNSCINASNVSRSSQQAVAYFNNNNGNFPIDEGVVIRSGVAKHSEGVYTGNDLSSQLNSNSDQDLEDINTQQNQSSIITDVAYLEYDFIPLSSTLTFSFVFASNEYGEWQCLSTDAIGFILTNLNTGVTKNMAVIPGSTTPVSARTIRNYAHNTACNSQNANRFAVYNVGNPNTSLNMRGYTKVLNALATVNPGDNYRIRFVVGDGFDEKFDSAVFLKAESFKTEVDLGADKLLCQGESLSLDSGFDDTVFYHEWLLNGTIIPNENFSTLTVTQEGSYTVEITAPNGNCTVSDTIEIFGFSVNTPSNIDVCLNPDGYALDLSTKEPEILSGNNPAEVDLVYYTSLANATANTNSIAAPENYILPANFGTQTIWVVAQSNVNPDCSTMVSFQINELALPLVDSLPNVVECSQYILPTLANGNYFDASGAALSAGDVIQSAQRIYIKNGPDANGCENESSFRVYLIEEYNISEFSCGTYTVPNLPGGDFYTAIDGPNGTGTLIPAGTQFTSDQTIYFYAIVNGVVCRNEQLNIQVPPLPPVDTLSNVVVCNSYTLPNLTNGQYFTQTAGGGNQLNQGHVLTSSRRVYVFSDDGTCTSETSFFVRIIPDFVDVEACGSYTLPNLQPGSVYRTQAGGNGLQIPEGTVITSSQTIFVYAQTTDLPNCTDNLSFYVLVKPIPPVDSLIDAELVCDTGFYILPTLSNGEYFTASNRGGNQLFAGDSITSGQTIYINSELNGCQNETSFEIIENYLPELGQYDDVLTCDPYSLPIPANGNFYTQSGGQGTMLQGGDIITTSQTIYLYNFAQGEGYSCFNETSFYVDILGIVLDEVEDVTACDNYILPALSAGNYFTESGGNGTLLQAGDSIDVSQTIYVYAINGVRFICETEKSFEVTIVETPVLPAFQDVERCGSYTLPEISDVNYEVDYYWQPNGVDKIDEEAYAILTPGSYTIYVYAYATNSSNCIDESQFNLTIYPIPELPVEGEDQVLCLDPETNEAISPITINTGADPLDFEVHWYLNGTLIHTGFDYSVEQPGVYTIITEKLTPEANGICNYSDTVFEISGASQPIVNAVVGDDFSGENFIEVYTVGYGTFLYQLDQGDFQEDNVFYNVTSGLHTITVKGINGECGATTVEVVVLSYPKFFTPNNDGQNDYWNISDLKYLKDANAKIMIYNRYGKLLNVISPYRSGWDGTYNGSQMPSNDYWFKATYKRNGQQKEYVSHFTLKR